MKERFRQAGTLSEFYHELEEIISRCEDVLVWQTDITGKRIKINARIVSYKADPSQTLISISSPKLDEFKKKLGFFMYDEKDGFLFKGKFLRQEHSSYLLVADENVFLREKRLANRLYFQFTKVFVDVKYGDRLDFHNLLLKDISEDGFGLLVTESKSKAFLEGMSLGITKIHNIELPRPLNGKIIHRSIVTQKDHPDDTKVKLGVKFNKKSKLVQIVRQAMDE